MIGEWAPLDDDKDAFRLMVKLGMEVRVDTSLGAHAGIHVRPEKQKGYWLGCYEPVGAGTPAAAVRRAIVSVAAAYAKALEKQETANG